MSATSKLNPEQLQRIEQTFEKLAGIPISQILKPISDDEPSGESLKANGVYSAIKNARSADDPNLPMGEWQHNLKVADWDEVVDVSVKALSEKTKDLQIAIWLLEAQIYKFGFAGIAPVVHMISQMTNTFWQDMHPQIEGGDLDYRTNLIAWMNDKLQPAIRQLPITDNRSDKQFCWADWEMSIQMEQLADDSSRKSRDYIPSQTIVHAITTTPIDFYKAVVNQIQDALLTFDELSVLLDEKCGEDSPSLTGFTTLLMEVRDTLISQVQHRGLFASKKAENSDEQNSVEADTASGGMPGGGGSGPLNTRESAYRLLGEAAEYLLREDPHSPVPYLVFKAIEWGNLNTAELYEELFVKYQGQLNIFEVLGLEIKK